MRQNGLSVERVRTFDHKLISKYRAMEDEAFGEGGFNEWVLPVFIRYGMVFVLKKDNRHIGLAHFIRSFDQQSKAFLAGFSIRKDQRGRGFGTVFLKNCMSSLKRRKITEVLVTTDDKNIAAVKMYQKLGFEAVEDLSHEYGKGKHRKLLRKVL